VLIAIRDLRNSYPASENSRSFSAAQASACERLTLLRAQAKPHRLKPACRQVGLCYLLTHERPDIVGAVRALATGRVALAWEDPSQGRRSLSRIPACGPQGFWPVELNFSI